MTKHYKMEEGDIVSWKVIEKKCIAFHYKSSETV